MCNIWLVECILFIKLATVVEGNLKVPFSIATAPRCRGERSSYTWIATIYLWYVPYIAEC